jgi:hypothetical protein
MFDEPNHCAILPLRNHDSEALREFFTGVRAFLGTSEYDDLRCATVSCEIIDIPRRAAVQWRMPAEIPNDHLTEIATILAAGLLRLQSRKSSPNFPLQADSSLDCERVFGGDVGGDFEDFRP